MADHFPAQLFHQLGRGQGGAAGGQQVIDDQDFLAGLDAVLVDFQGVAAVFQGVLFADGPGRQLARLARRDETAAQLVGQHAAEDEAARLDAHDLVDGLRPGISSPSGSWPGGRRRRPAAGW